MTHPFLVIASASVLLSGCAAAGIETSLSEPLPPAALTYRLAPATGALPAQVREAVDRGLQIQGWRPVMADEDGAAWSIETLYAIRPATTGAYSDAAARREEWTVAPRPSSWWRRNPQRRSLAVILRRPDSVDVYHAEAAIDTGRQDEAATLEALAEALALALSSAPGER